MQSNSTTRSYTIGHGSYVFSAGERVCVSCGATIPAGETHLAFGPRLEIHQCNRCTAIATGLQAVAA